MISILDRDNILSSHEIFELTHAFFINEEIKISKSKNYENARLQLLIFKKRFSIKGILIDKFNNRISKEIEFEVLNIYRDDISTERIIAKQVIYKLFKKASGTSLPWGILTGIRPTKIVHRLFNLNINSADIFIVLIKGYLLSAEKAELLIDIAKKQRKTLKNIGVNSYSLYINIPFCPSRCSYCSFPSLSASEYSNEMNNYIETLLKELELSRQKMINWDINSVYIGGGTPTSLNHRQMERLIFEIKNKHPNINEFSIEAGRPDTLDYEYLKLFKKYGIDRISINPQTMNDRTLKIIKRSHTEEDIINCFKQAKEIGIKFINMDIILGLPGEKIADLNYTINKIKQLKPDNLTVHVLAIKTGSDYKYNKYISKHENDNLIDKMLEASRLGAKEMKLDPYYLYRQKNSLGNFENVGYSSEESICNYNISIMEEKETIIGVGMGAVSKIYDKELDKLMRLPNYKNLKDYTTKLDNQVSKKNLEIDKIEKGNARYPFVPENQR